METLNISIPATHYSERSYVLEVVFESFLGLSIKLNQDPKAQDYTISFGDKKLIIKDFFFSNLNESTTYLTTNNIPKSSIAGKSSYCDKYEVFYGNDAINKVDQNTIVCEIDVFASIFFMLTRWEEMCIEQKDKHLRTLESELFCIKQRIQHRPVVNEWIELIWNLLKELNFTGERLNREFSIKITHDVDHIARYDSFNKLIRAFAGDLILRKRPWLVLHTLWEYFNVNFLGKTDNYDTSNWLMDISEEFGTISHFYFMPTLKNEFDARYDINDVRIKNTIDTIAKRGHKVGIHPSYNTFKNQAQFNSEIKRLQNIYPKIEEGRQHYLRFSNPETWQIWNDAGMTYDSTVGFATDIGFRAGTCYEYPVFDVVNRKKLHLVEQPLIIMEGALIRYLDVSDNSVSIAQKVIDECKKYQGKFVFLWHPENFNHPFWGKYAYLYRNLLDHATRQ